MFEKTRMQTKKMRLLFILLVIFFGWVKPVAGEENIRFTGEVQQVKGIDKIVEILRHPQLKCIKEKIYYSHMNVIERINREPLSDLIRVVFIADTLGYKEFKLMISQMEELNKKPVVVLHGGDFAKKGTLKHYQKHLEITASSPFNVIHAPGNHDLSKDGKYLFERLFGKTYFSFSYKNIVKFIVINNADKKHLGNYGMDEEQFHWFEQELKKVSPRIKIVVGHVPPTRMFKPYSHNIFFQGLAPLLNEQEFLELMKHRHVGLYLCGHHHFGATLRRDDLRIVISGGGGQKIGITGVVKTPLFTKRKHFTIVDIDYKNMCYLGYLVKMGQNPNVKDPELCFAGHFK